MQFNEYKNSQRDEESQPSQVYHSKPERDVDPHNCTVHDYASANNYRERDRVRNTHEEREQRDSTRKTYQYERQEYRKY